MTGVYLGEDLEKQDGDSSFGVTTYAHFHKVITDHDETFYVARNAPGMPREGSVHREDPLARCGNVGVEEVKWIREENGDSTKALWILRADYSTEVTIYENPLLEPAEIWYTGEQFQRSVYTNRRGEVIQNAAGTPVKGLFVDDSRPIANISKNVVDTFAVQLEMPDVLNDAPFTFDNVLSVDTNVAKWKFGGLSKRQIRNGIRYKVLTFQLHFRRDKWKLKYPNAGLYQKNPNDPSKPWPCFDAQGAQATTDMPLKLNGEQLSDPKPSNIITLDDDVYDEADFSSIAQYWN